MSKVRKLAVTTVVIAAFIFAHFFGGPATKGASTGEAVGQILQFAIWYR